MSLAAKLKGSKTCRGNKAFFGKENMSISTFGIKYHIQAQLYVSKYDIAFTYFKARIIKQNTSNYYFMYFLKSDGFGRLLLSRQQTENREVKRKNETKLKPESITRNSRGHHFAYQGSN